MAQKPKFNPNAEHKKAAFDPAASYGTEAVQAEAPPVNKSWWETAAGDVGSFVAQSARSLLPGHNPMPEQQPGEDMYQAADRVERERQRQFQANVQARKDEGRSAPYRALANTVEATRLLNPRSMEEAANRGATGEVVGHAIPPVLMAAAPALTRGAVKVGKATTTATGEAISGARQAVAERVLEPSRYSTTTGELIKGKLKPGARLTSQVTGAATGAVAGGAGLGPFGFLGGGAAGWKAGPSVLSGSVPARAPTLKVQQELTAAFMNKGYKPSKTVTTTPATEVPGAAAKGAIVVPESAFDVQPQSGSKWSVPRETLPERALRGEAGTGAVLRQVGEQPVLVEPRGGTGYAQSGNRFAEANFNQQLKASEVMQNTGRMQNTARFTQAPPEMVKMAESVGVKAEGIDQMGIASFTDARGHTINLNPAKVTPETIRAAFAAKADPPSIHDSYTAFRRKTGSR